MDESIDTRRVLLTFQPKTILMVYNFPLKSCKSCFYHRICLLYIMCMLKMRTVNDADGKTLARELTPLESIRDHNPKYLIMQS